MSREFGLPAAGSPDWGEKTGYKAGSAMTSVSDVEGEVVGSGMTTLIRVPRPPGPVSTDSVAPTCDARSRIVSKPKPGVPPPIRALKWCHG